MKAADYIIDLGPGAPSRDRGQRPAGWSPTRSATAEFLRAALALPQREVV